MVVFLWTDGWMGNGGERGKAGNKGLGEMNGCVCVCCMYVCGVVCMWKASAFCWPFVAVVVRFQNQSQATSLRLGAVEAVPFFVFPVVMVMVVYM
ncbi:uncharacterized protein K452DRAFT_134398 [Aplosporella prunicola CBS 121167]|uniref:Transmembrane protein n=1 Tax=Aplosporella prunicola CBS 121167 TaxID=1176127 RepID=A0A6A6BM11_9PEZI|nr:uncharacterized protein K452DRAFT_134398 [Aplosporella prunicola CBS 121167]KAF2145086.1 hypothetical protein K452DRAFT_134398 [Aplosporella prunicola CBS 121167]